MIRKRREIHWHDSRVAAGSVQFVQFPFRLWQTEFEIRERLVGWGLWERDVRRSKKGKVTDTGIKQIRPIAVWFRSENDFAAFPQLTFKQIDPQWIEREKVILARGHHPK